MTFHDQVIAGDEPQVVMRLTIIFQTFCLLLVINKNIPIIKCTNKVILKGNVSLFTNMLEPIL